MGHRHAGRFRAAGETEDRTEELIDCVAPDRCNPAAHGGVTLVEECQCGAVRRLNVNGDQIEVGAWEVPDQVYGVHGVPTPATERRRAARHWAMLDQGDADAD